MFSYKKDRAKKIVFPEIQIIPIKVYTPNCERASQFTSQGGYMTVEASLIIPLFLIVLMGFALWIQAFMVEAEIQKGVSETGRYLARQLYLYQKLNKGEEIISPVIIKAKWKDYVDEEFLENSCLKEGVAGVSFGGSKYDEAEDKLKIYAKYKIYFPLMFLGNYEFSVRTQIEQKAFTGYDNPKEEYVYVAESASVFHTDRNCTYIALIIQKVYDTEAYFSGKKSYSACEKCAAHYGKVASYLYITKYGDKYHTSLQCSALKRTIKKVKLGKTKGLGKCVRCQKKEES